MRAVAQAGFVSPSTGRPLRADGDELVAEGERFPIRDGIPRFVEDLDYVRSFGPQWRRYREVQLDSKHGRTLSRERLFDGTGWSDDELAGERILEVGCGAGRFTEILLSSGADVWSVDATTAVDACRETAGDHPKLTLAQADLFALPFRERSFDRVLCYGVLQHTPDPGGAFVALSRFVRPGGEIAVDAYRKQTYVDRRSAKRLWRPLTYRLPPDLLRRIVEWYVPRWLPIDDRLTRVPKLGRFLTAVVPCWNYVDVYDLDREAREAWAVLDTFDALAPRYDKPQTVESMRAWCDRAGVVDADVRYGGNGVLVNARAPQSPAASSVASSSPASTE